VITTCVLMLGVVAGCSTSRARSEGKEAVDHQNWDAAVYHYLELLAKHPDHVEYKIGLRRARQNASHEHFERGMALRKMGQLVAARRELEMAVQLDPTNQYAEQVLEDLEEEIEIISRPGGLEELEEMKKRAREAKVKPPVLDPKSKEPITLNFPRPKPVKEIYQAMGKAYGFNVIFDPKLRDDKMPIELNDVTAERALELVMQHAGHFYKVLDEHTIIVAEDTPQNRREYEDLVMKTFFLSNAEVKEVDKLLRSLIEARRLATNEQLNAITLRDTADKVAIAERLITAIDKAKAEVLVDVELMEVDTTNQSELGMNLSTYSFTLQADLAQVSPDAPSGTSFLDDLGNISSSNVFINVPSIIINLIKSSGKAHILAQPQLRITEGEKATLHLGDQVPIPVTSFNTSNTIGGSVVPVTSFQYRDVGIKIDVEPRVHHNREVTLNLTVEVSQLGETVPVGPDQEAVTIGTRTITSVIRLKSGESSLLAGLIRKDTTEGESKTPLLSDIPGLGRLFTNKRKQAKTIDLVLTLTPHIIRFPDIQEEDLAPIWVGTESKISFSGSRSPRVQSGRTREGPFDQSREVEQQRRTVRPPSPRPQQGSGGDSAYGVPRARGTPSPGTPGVELVPDGSSKSLQPTPVPDNRSPITALDSSHPPLVIGLEPSVISLAEGEETTLQLVVRDAPEAYRMPIGISFDPDRIEVDSFEVAPGVQILDGSLDEGGGWLSLDLMVLDGRETAHGVAAIRVRAMAPGPVPLVFTSAGATTMDGVAVPVAAGDGALYVTPGTAWMER
jgi:general secretion pathway protein D